MSSIRINWVDNSNDEDGFHVYRSFNGQGESLLRDVPTDVVTVTDGPELAEGTYVYSISAFNSEGESARVASNPVVVPAAPPVVPAAPSEVVATLEP